MTKFSGSEHAVLYGFASERKRFFPYRRTHHTITSDFKPVRNRGTYMRAQVLLSLLNELGKRDKMRGLSSILSLIRNEFINNYYKSTNVRFHLSDYFAISFMS